MLGDKTTAQSKGNSTDLQDSKGSISSAVETPDLDAAFQAGRFARSRAMPLASNSYDVESCLRLHNPWRGGWMAEDAEQKTTRRNGG